MMKNFNIYANNYKKTDAQPDYRLVAKTNDKAFNVGVAWKKTGQNGSYLSVALDKPREYEKDGQTVKLDGYLIISESEYNELLRNQKDKIPGTDIDYPEDDINPEDIPFN